MAALGFRFFTMADWLRLQVDPDDPAVREAARLQWDHYQSIRDDLPAAFREAQDMYEFHGARVLSISVELDRNRVVMRLAMYVRNAPPSQPQTTVRMTYSDARCLVIEPQPGGFLPPSEGFGEIGHDEVELVSGGMVEHRMLFSSAIGMSVRFRRFTFAGAGDA
jgi:hypothetical protein